MATYKETAEFIQANDGFSARNCWIADVLASYGLTSRVAPDREGKQRKYSCPSNKRPAIKRELKKFGKL